MLSSFVGVPIESFFQIYIACGQSRIAFPDLENIFKKTCQIQFCHPNCKARRISEVMLFIPFSVILNVRTLAC